jgi:hypothetical protein
MIANAPLPQTSPSFKDEKIGFNDRAFIRLAAAVVEEPEEVILASLLALRSKSGDDTPRRWESVEDL